MVEVIVSRFNIPLTSALFIISAYGYTMAILGLLAGYISAKFTVKTSLYSSALLTFIGLLGRGFSSNFTLFLIFSIIAAIGYPLAIAPVGSIAEAIFKKKPHTFVGISVGILFLGMSIGSFLGPSIYESLGFRLTMLTPAILSAISLFLILVGIKDYPKYYTRSLRGAFKVGMVKNWYIGLAISSILVMLGSIGSVVLELHGLFAIAAVALGGLFSGLSLLGSALGAIILPTIFENYNTRIGIVLSGSLTFLSAVLVVYGLEFTVSILLISSSYFIFGFFGNAYWSMTLTSTMNYVKDPAEAGVATSMYSVISNVGVAFIPVFLGSLFSDSRTIVIAGIIVIIMELTAGLLSFTLKTRS
ncbi:hypothetical protein HS5_04220 [Acidianus sp. HS-5]|nr:hypothetical protein HS5_04220 [Acidianus sp. HS-5]